MQEGITADLVAILGVTAVLLILGLVAVALFIRQYRKEQKEKQGRDR